MIDLISYVKDKISVLEKYSICVGCDSQTKGKETKYVCVVVINSLGSGSHIIHADLNFPAIRDRFSKLWKEVEISLEVANFLTKNGIFVDYVDLDLNPNPIFGSNNVYKAAMGFVESAGYKVRAKPISFCASYAADHLI